MSTKNEKLLELEVLEELFIDQLQFKLRALFLLLNIGSERRRELISYFSELEELTFENLAIIRKNIPHD